MLGISLTGRPFVNSILRCRSATRTCWRPRAHWRRWLMMSRRSIPTRRREAVTSSPFPLPPRAIRCRPGHRAPDRAHPRPAFSLPPGSTGRRRAFVWPQRHPDEGCACRARDLGHRPRRSGGARHADRVRRRHGRRQLGVDGRRHCCVVIASLGRHPIGNLRRGSSGELRHQRLQRDADAPPAHIVHAIEPRPPIPGSAVGHDMRGEPITDCRREVGATASVRPAACSAIGTRLHRKFGSAGRWARPLRTRPLRPR